MDVTIVLKDGGTDTHIGVQAIVEILELNELFVGTGGDITRYELNDIDSFSGVIVKAKIAKTITGCMESLNKHIKTI